MIVSALVEPLTLAMDMENAVVLLGNVSATQTGKRVLPVMHVLTTGLAMTVQSQRWAIQTQVLRSAQ